jgi:exonuclease III
VRSVFQKIVRNVRIIALKVEAEPVNTVIVQVYIPTTEYEDEEVEELYGVIEEILEEDRKDATKTTILGEGNIMVKR